MNHIGHILALHVNHNVGTQKFQLDTWENLLRRKMRMQLENADAGVGGKPHREGGLPQKLEPGHKNYGGATKVCHRPQESTREHMIQIQMQIQIQIQMNNKAKWGELPIH